MVKLPGPTEQPGRAVGERGSFRAGARNHRAWGFRFGRRREEARMVEPTGLLQLEELARRTVTLMEKHNPKSDANYRIAMDLLRLQYNLHFIVLCEKCGGTHDSDELLAPER